LTEDGFFGDNQGQIPFIPRTQEIDPRNPLYKINNAGHEAPLLAKTVSAEALHFNNTLHYNLHNLYGIIIHPFGVHSHSVQATANPS
jgi:hypothetical protein